MAKYIATTAEGNPLVPHEVPLGEHVDIGQASKEAQKLGLLPAEIAEVNAPPLHQGGGKVQRAFYAQ